VNARENVSRRKIGFLDGLLAPLDGLRFVVGTPSTWGWACVPLVVLLALVVALAWAALALVHHWGASWRWMHVAPFWGTIAIVFLDVILVALAIVVAWMLAVPISGFALERIVRRRQRALALPAHAQIPAWRASMRSFGASLASTVVAIVTFVVLTVVDFVAPPATIVTVPMRVFVAALALAWDVLDYPLSLRPLTLRSRIAWFFRHFSASAGFGLALSLLFFVPGANLLLLPASVAGAAKLVSESERRA
jgi:CysZ protein